MSGRSFLQPRGRVAAGGIAALVVTVSLSLSGCADIGGPLWGGEATDVPVNTPSLPPVRVEQLAAGETQNSLTASVEGPVTVTYRRITIEPGAGTGLHCHHGQLIGVVEAGTLTHRAPVYPEGVHVYRAGDALLEGPNYVHEGVNEGSENVVLLVTYVTEEGQPLAETDLARCSSEH